MTTFGFIAEGIQNEPTRLSSSYPTRERAELAARSLWEETDCYKRITIVEILDVIR